MRDKRVNGASRKAYVRWRRADSVCPLSSRHSVQKRASWPLRRQPMQPRGARSPRAIGQRCCWRRIAWRILRWTCDSAYLWLARRNSQTTRSAVDPPSSMWGIRCRCAGSTLGRGYNSLELLCCFEFNVYLLCFKT